MRDVERSTPPSSNGRHGKLPGAAPDPQSPDPKALFETNGHRNGGDRHDRSHLLRRHPKLPPETDDDTGIRLRRRRRVSAPFSAVPGLARDTHAES